MPHNSIIIPITTSPIRELHYYLLEPKLLFLLSSLHVQIMNPNPQPSPKTYSHEADKHYLVQVNQESKCICELCSCGKHRCPRPAMKGQFQTSYNNHYKDTHILIPTNPPPQHYYPQTLRTNYKESFTDKPHIENAEVLNRSRLENIGKSVLRPSVPFYGNSSYSEQFKPFSLQSNYNPEEDIFIAKREKIPHYGFQSPAKFDDTTAYKDYFQAPSPAKLEKSPYPEHRKPEMPFQGASSYKSQFKQYNVQPSYENYYSKSLSQAPRVKFEGQTTYKDLFKGFTVMPEQSTGKGCAFQNMGVPQSNFLHSSPHIDNLYK